MPRGVHRENGAGRVDRGAYVQLARDLSTGFPQPSEDDAPAGGISRPAMHSCGLCGEMTSTDRGMCADCSEEN
jgi:hypothetical protein